jgi:hypothetical protein
MTDTYDELYQLLCKISIPFKNKRNNRKGFPKHRAITFGLVKKRFSGKIEPSVATIRRPAIYEKIKELAKSFDFPFTSVHLNHNVICPPHKDDKNVGLSLIVSFGEYKGGSLVIEGEEVNTFKTPVIFDGSSKEHFNNPDLEGNKYSLVFYSIKT